MSLLSLLLWALLIGVVTAILYRIGSQNSFSPSNSSSASDFSQGPVFFDAGDSGGPALSYHEGGHGHGGIDSVGHHDGCGGDSGGHGGDCGAGHH